MRALYAKTYIIDSTTDETEELKGMKYGCSAFGSEEPCAGFGCKVIAECRHEAYLRRTAREEGVTVPQLLRSKRGEP